MEYTPEIVSKLKTLLEKIQEEENRAIDLCKKLNKQHQKMAEKNETLEYYFDCFISVFSFDEDFCKKHDIEEGFYYYSEDCQIFWDDEEAKNMNWIEGYFQFEEDPTLRDLHFCHTAFCLFSALSLEDFLAMEKLIFELRVNYPLTSIIKRKTQPMKEKSPEEPNYLFLDVEVTGVPQNFQTPVSNTENWPRMVKLHWIYKGEGIEEELATGDYLIKPQDYSMPKAAMLIHGISTEFAKENGVDLQETLGKLLKVIRKADCIVGYIIGFDVKVVASELIRNQMEDEISTKEMIDTIVKKNETYEFMGFEYKPNPRALYLRFSDANKFLFDMDDPDLESKTSTFESVEWQVKQFYKMKELIEKHQLRKAVNDRWLYFLDLDEN